jgi:hypothetical protein
VKEANSANAAKKNHAKVAVAESLREFFMLGLDPSSARKIRCFF